MSISVCRTEVTTKRENIICLEGYFILFFIKKFSDNQKRKRKREVPHFSHALDGLMQFYVDSLRKININHAYKIK